MTCYFRHMGDIFDDASIVVTSENKKQIDREIHNIVGVGYKNCSETWKAVKNRISENRPAFVSALRKAVQV